MWYMVQRIVNIRTSSLRPLIRASCTTFRLRRVTAGSRVINTAVTRLVFFSSFCFLHDSLILLFSDRLFSLTLFPLLFLQPSKAHAMYLIYTSNFQNKLRQYQQCLFFLRVQTPAKQFTIIHTVVQAASWRSASPLFRFFICSLAVAALFRGSQREPPLDSVEDGHPGCQPTGRSAWNQHCGERELQILEASSRARTPQTSTEFSPCH